MKVFSICPEYTDVRIEEYKTLYECADSVGIALTPNRVQAIVSKEKPFVIKIGNYKYAWFSDNDPEYEKKCKQKALKKMLS
ncbi:MAG: hypothetical protein LBF97_05945 [Elusimicrobiota bacterium]|nr:hypothetical protein [Elusimicrobiota bacterium]